MSLSSPASFKPVDWSYSTNIYEVNLRQYTKEGTFEAFGRELPRLRDMGIEILWFMPITPISVEKRKGTLGSYYACSDYTATNPEFGSPADFKDLVQAAHGLGFKVIIDWVANHTGWDHRWTREHPEYYRKNHEGQFYEMHGWEDVIDLNYDSKDLQTAMIEAMQWWVQHFDIDGFRCDMAMLVPLDFWRQARTALDKGKPLFWLAECEEIAYHEVFDATYTWKFLHRMEEVWRKESGIDGLDEVLGYYDKQFPPTAFRAYFTTNHDENSHSGSEYERMGDAALPFAVLCCTWNGLPLIYSGQELPNLKRLQFFDKDPIEWTGVCKLHDFYKTLLGLRKANPALRAGDVSVQTHRLGARAMGDAGAETAAPGIFAFLRKHPSAEVLVVLNLSAEAQTIRFDEPGSPRGSFTEVFGKETVDLTTDQTVSMPAWGYKVLFRLCSSTE